MREEVFKIIYSQSTCSQFIRFVKVSDSDSFSLCSCRLPICFTHFYEQVGNLKILLFVRFATVTKNLRSIRCYRP